jgi:hypothetical protein
MIGHPYKPSPNAAMGARLGLAILGEDQAGIGFVGVGAEDRADRIDTGRLAADVLGRLEGR